MTTGIELMETARNVNRGGDTWASRFQGYGAKGEGLLGSGRVEKVRRYLRYMDRALRLETPSPAAKLGTESLLGFVGDILYSQDV